MTFEQFKEEAAKRLGSQTKNKVIIGKVEKNNGAALEAVTIEKGDGSLSPVIYLEGFYRELKEGRPFDEIIRQILQLGEMDPGDSLNWLADNIPCFEAVRGKISYRLIHYEKNAGRLKGMPHRRFLDLAVVYQVVCIDSGFGVGAVLINWNHADAWGVTEEELYRLAEENSPKLLPAEIGSVGDILRKMGMECGFREEELELPGGGVPLYTLTNTQKYMGAACILYPDIVRRISDVLGCSLFILPSSVHEMLILPDNGMHTADALREMVCEVNQTQVAEEEILSYGVYWYEQGKGIQLV